MEIRTILMCIFCAINIFVLGVFVGKAISHMDAFIQGKISEATNLLAILAHINQLEPEKDEERETE